jgi:hypothetical protein
MLKKVGRPAWLVNVYFLDDPIGPTTEQDWCSEIQNIKNSLGLPPRIPNAVDVFLPFLADTSAAQEETAVSAHEVEDPTTACIMRESLPRLCVAQRLHVPSDFRSWAQEWMELASYPGPSLLDPEVRIQRILSLWREPVPGSWQRSLVDIPSRLLNGKRYTRGDEADPRSGEHRIEHEILCQHFDNVTYSQHGRIVDGINAFPLVRDSGGGRNGNVEADLLLLVRNDSGYRLIVTEVKHSANNAWFAAVENLRQLRLLISGTDPGHLFRQRNLVLRLPAGVPMSGIVIAPNSFYSQPGQKVNSIPAVRELLRALRDETDTDLRLMVWDVARQNLSELR